MYLFTNGSLDFIANLALALLVLSVELIHQHRE